MCFLFGQKFHQRVGIPVDEIGEHQVIRRLEKSEFQAEDYSVTIPFRAGANDVERSHDDMAVGTHDRQSALGIVHLPETLDNVCRSNPDCTPAGRHIHDRGVRCTTVKANAAATRHREAGMPSKLAPLGDHPEGRRGDQQIEKSP
jgi:hypothetical protein